MTFVLVDRGHVIDQNIVAAEPFLSAETRVLLLRRLFLFAEMLRRLAQSLLSLSARLQL